MKKCRPQYLLLALSLSLTHTSAGAAPPAEEERETWPEREFLDLVMNRSSEHAVGVLGAPAAKSQLGNGLEIWIYRHLVRKPRHASTFAVTQLVVSQGRVVQIGHSERDPTQP